MNKYTLTATINPIPLVKIPQEFIDSQWKNISKRVKFDESIKTVGFSIDISALSKKDKYFVETEGDYPPTWISWWLNIAADMQFDEDIYGYCGFIFYGSNPHSFKLSDIFRSEARSSEHFISLNSLLPNEMCENMYHPAWKMSASAACAIGWNMKEEANEDWSFTCKGAIVPVFDGLGFILITTRDEDRERILKGITEIK